jgi:hypothetical protein
MLCKRLLILLVLLLLCGVSHEATASSKYALLIGIKDYNAPGVSPLPGAVNDVDLLKSTLVTRLGFDESNIVVLKDAGATHTGIKDGFSALAQTIGTGDFVYIHYSGHGSRYDDQHSTWVPFGARVKRGETREIDDYDILDTEVVDWLKAIYAKTQNVILVSDSCHSGFFTRGSVSGYRQVVRDPRPHPLETKDSRPGEFFGAKVSAAKDDEQASEYTAGDGTKYGRFTWFWVKSILDANAGETWNDTFKRTYTRTVFSDAGQHPVFNGALRLGVIDGQVSYHEVKSVPVKSVETYADGKTTVVLKAGELESITTGSIYKKMGADDGSRIEITKVSSFESEGSTTSHFAKGDLVVEESHMFHNEPLKLYVHSALPQDHRLVAELQKSIQSMSGYTQTDRQDSADYVLDLAMTQAENRQETKTVDGVQGDEQEESLEIQVLTRSERPLTGKIILQLQKGEADFGGIAETLKRIGKIRALQALTSPNEKKSPIEMRILHWVPAGTKESSTLAEQNTKDFREFKFDADEKKLFKHKEQFNANELDQKVLGRGDILTFELENHSRQENFYCYLMDIDSKGRVEFVFPSNGDDRGKIYVNGKKTVRDFILVDVTGEETVKLLVTKQEIDYESLSQSGYAERGAAQKGARNPLYQILADASEGESFRTRGPVNDEWFSEQFTFIGR